VVHNESGGNNMAISKDSKRLAATLPLEIYKLLEDRAKKENRTVSNMLTTILMKEFGVKPE
jgi:hypothetical protein